LGIGKTSWARNRSVKKGAEQQKKKGEQIFLAQSGTQTQHPGLFEFLAGLILNEMKQFQGTANTF